MRLLGFIFVFSVSLWSIKGSKLLQYLNTIVFVITTFIVVSLDFNWPEIKVTGQSQTVRVPNCPNSAFYLTFSKPIQVIHLSFLLCYPYYITCSPSKQKFSKAATSFVVKFCIDYGSPVYSLKRTL